MAPGENEFDTAALGGGASDKLKGNSGGSDHLQIDNQSDRGMSITWEPVRNEKFLLSSGSNSAGRVYSYVLTGQVILRHALHFLPDSNFRPALGMGGRGGMQAAGGLQHPLLVPICKGQLQPKTALPNS